MNRHRSVLLCALALATALLGGEAIRAASTVSWELARTGLPASGIVRDVAFADVNLDGKGELVAALTGAPSLVVYGRDAGIWSSAGLNTGLPTSGFYERLVVGDIFLDGKPSVAAIRQGDAGVAAWRGDGTGSWVSTSPNLPTTGVYRGIALADHVERDSWLLVAGPADAGIQNYIYQPMGMGGFTRLDVTTTGTYNEVAVAYVDEDKWIDIAATSASAGVRFWKTGIGISGLTWFPANTGLPATGQYRALALGDLDNDAWTELVTSRAGVSPAGGGIFIYDWDNGYNFGAGRWILAANQISATNSFGRIQLRDINNDGWLDVIAAGYPTEGGQGIAAWLSGPSGFSLAASPAITSSLSSLALADFDVDGLTDLAAGDSSNFGVLAWRGSGVRQTLGNWREAPSPRKTGSPIAVGFGDLNRDGHLDLVLPTSTVGLEGWLGDGGESWPGGTCPGLAKNVGSGAYGDILMGVFPEVGQDATIIAARTDNGGITFIHGINCSGGGGESSITTNGSYAGLSAGDIFRDGRLSLVAAPAVAKGGLMLWQYGGVSWGAPSSLAIGATIRDTALGDVDHDGKLEIATADSGGAGVSVYDINTSGTAWLRGILTATGEYYAVGIGDVNNDGDLDVVAAKNGADTGIDVWIGAGSAITWTRHDGPGATGQYYGLDLADFNHDGELDILAARDGEGVMVWAGNGAGLWTPASANLPTTGVFYSASFGDIDHDGNLDILATQAGGGLRMWIATEADIYRVYLPLIFRGAGGQ
jgi:hypothetical protein